MGGGILWEDLLNEGCSGGVILLVVRGYGIYMSLKSKWWCRCIVCLFV